MNNIENLTFLDYCLIDEALIRFINDMEDEYSEDIKLNLNEHAFKDKHIIEQLENTRKKLALIMWELECHL